MTTTTDTIVMEEAHTAPHTTWPDRMKFPNDFPAIPPGVVIVPFKEFKERGICVEAGPDGEEVDALGIPTVSMSKSHDQDRCKSNSNRQRRSQESKKRTINGNAVPWWEQWEYDEVSRYATSVDLSAGKVTRFLAAAADFKTGRPWPVGIGQQTDPAFIWLKFEKFLGITSTKVGKKRKPKVFLDMPDESMSEDEDDEEGGHNKDEEFVTGKDKKAANFIKDPERSTKVFLSSYARKEGFIWSEINCVQMPHLIRFFLEFLIRSRVLRELETALQLAIEVTKLALVELPIAKVLSEHLARDSFGHACRPLWGTRAEEYLSYKVFEEDTPSVPPPDVKIDQDEERVDNPQPEDPAQSKFELVSTNAWGDPVGDAAWGTGDTDASHDAWDTLTPEVATEAEDNPWLKEVDEPLKAQLPAALASTHTTGIVEQSVRCIKKFIPVPTNLPPHINSPTPDAGDVETELERSFPKVVLGPCLGWDDGTHSAYSEPKILNTSRGLVTEPPYTAHEEEKAQPAGLKCHNPATDDINVLVDPTVFEAMLKAPGTLVGATWVQIVRLPKDTIQDGEPPAKKKKRSKKAADLWYMDVDAGVAGIFPSFWAM